MSDTNPAARLVRSDEVESVSQALAAAPLLAVDTEFHIERRYRPELLLVQVHVPQGDTFLLDPLAPGVIPGVAEALRAAPAWVVHAGGHDLRLLRAALGGLPERVWDTQLLAGLVDEIHPAGLARLTDRWLGVALDKGPQMSDWTARPLTATQLRYAAGDVRWLPRLLDEVLQRADALGRSDVAVAACDEARAAALEDDPLPGTLRRVAGQGDLSVEDLAVLYELVAWRDATARDQDRPPHYVMGDAMLRDLARSRPRSLDDLRANRRVSDKTVGRHGRALLAAIARADHADGKALPPVLRKGSPERRRAAWLEVLVSGAGATASFAQPLVLPRERAEELAVLPPPARHEIAKILGPWRDVLIGDLVAHALAGTVSTALLGGDVVLMPPSPIPGSTVAT